MKITNSKSDTASLRSKAKELLKTKSSKTAFLISADDTLKLIHELRVHKIDLGIQYEQRTTNNEQRTTNNEQRTTNNEQRTTNNEQRTTNNEQRTTNNEQRTTNNEQRTTNNEQRTTNNEQRTTSNEQRATNNEQLRLATPPHKMLQTSINYASSVYYTLSLNGEIIRLNIAGAQMLGKERSQLQTSRFGFFISEDTKPVFNLFLEKIFSTKNKKTCEVTLSIADKAVQRVHITGIVSGNGGQCLITVIDITDHTQPEMEIQYAREIVIFASP